MSHMKLFHIFLTYIIVCRPCHTISCSPLIISLTNWQQQIPGGDEFPDQPDAQYGLPKQHQQRHRHVHRNRLLLPQVSPNFINPSVFYPNIIRIWFKCLSNIRMIQSTCFQKLAEFISLIPPNHLIWNHMTVCSNIVSTSTIPPTLSATTQYMTTKFPLLSL